MTARPRGLCCACNREMPVLKSGRIQAHTVRRLGVRWPCDGENLPPRYPALVVGTRDENPTSKEAT